MVGGRERAPAAGLLQRLLLPGRREPDRLELRVRGRRLAFFWGGDRAVLDDHGMATTTTSSSISIIIISISISFSSIIIISISFSSIIIISISFSSIIIIFAGQTRRRRKHGAAGSAPRPGLTGCTSSETPSPSPATETVTLY